MSHGAMQGQPHKRRDEVIVNKLTLNEFYINDYNQSADLKEEKGRSKWIDRGGIRRICGIKTG
jgi:hypothetical protein